jgi:hypothetical protein
MDRDTVDRHTVRVGSQSTVGCPHGLLQTRPYTVVMAIRCKTLASNAMPLTVGSTTEYHLRSRDNTGQIFSFSFSDGYGDGLPW